MVNKTILLLFYVKYVIIFLTQILIIGQYYVLPSPKTDRKDFIMFKFFKKTRDFNEFQLMTWMSKHNQGKVEIAYNLDDFPRHLNSFVPLEDLTLPDGWYYTEKNELTNKHNSTTGSYSCVKIIWL